MSRRDPHDRRHRHPPGLRQVKAPAELLSIFWWSGVLEVAGSLLILLGLFTRPAAFTVAREMAVAYFWRHCRATSGPAATAARASGAWTPGCGGGPSGPES